MMRSVTYKIVLMSFLLCFGHSATAQNVKNILTEKNKRVQNYLELSNLGYTDEEIFQDLGNVNFLTKNYENAVFWYEKLIPFQKDAEIQGRYDFAIKQLNNQEITLESQGSDWLTSVKKDYMNSRPKKSMDKSSIASLIESSENIPVANQSFGDDYEPKITITEDGRVAYFSKAVYKKPLYGLFSKKELIHEIYRAENINGEWRNIEKVTVCPEYFSAMHPTVSNDGKRLYFASNMPGTFGEYDIFVAEIDANGKMGIAKNLGTKVNTKKDDMYPNLYNGTLLFFASEGHKGYGGLDLYAAQITENSLTSSVNLGQKINSNADEFAIELMPTEKMGYVATNRGMNGSTQQFAVSYAKQYDNTRIAKNEENLMQLLNDRSQIEYSTTVFEDK